MEHVPLSEIVKFIPGKNVTRIKTDNGKIYTPDDFDRDLLSCTDSEEKGNCIISLIRSKAAPISVGNMKKVITQNFLTCEFNENRMDPWYFCYQFNEGKSIEQQISRFHQGTTLSVKKLNVKSIGDLMINLPDINKQRVIGRIYKISLLQHSQMIKRADDLMKYSLEIIRIVEED